MFFGCASLHFSLDLSLAMIRTRLRQDGFFSELLGRRGSGGDSVGREIDARLKSGCPGGVAGAHCFYWNLTYLVLTLI
jgi:hypothetical protein